MKTGKIVLELPPCEGNPRNSEGAFIELKDCSLLFIYSKFIGSNWGDNSSACLAARISTDEGETWSEEKIILHPQEYNALNVMSVSLIRMLNGDIGLFYLIRYGWDDMRLHLSRSSDEGKSWGKPICCIQNPGYFVTNNDRVVRLKSGRLIIPAGYHRTICKNAAGAKTIDTRGIVFFYLSDDDGAAWRESKSCCVMPVSRSESGLQEPGVIELNNRTLWAWARTDMGYQYEMNSLDGGETWSAPSPSVFSSPCSPLSMKRIPLNGSILAVWNPIPNYCTRQTGRFTYGRNPLIGAVSRDDGKSWGSHFTIEMDEDNDKSSGYCYTAMHFVKDAVLLAYCAGRPEDGCCLSRLRMRKIPLTGLCGESTKSENTHM